MPQSTHNLQSSSMHLLVGVQRALPITPNILWQLMTITSNGTLLIADEDLDIISTCAGGLSLLACQCDVKHRKGAKVLKLILTCHFAHLIIMLGRTKRGEPG